MKKRSGKNLIRFFYHLLVVLAMALPMLSGLVRVIYVQSNMNAKDSYFGDTINQSQIVYSNDLFTNEHYYIDNRIQPALNFSNFSNIQYYVIDINSSSNVDLTNCAYFRLYFDNTGRLEVICFNSSNTLIADIYITNGNYLVDFTLLRTSNIANNNNSIGDTDIFYFYSYNQYSYLDNAFDYSIWKTMQDFTFHSDFRFTDIANGLLMTFDNNNLYIQYTNFYINWVLTCAVISFAPYIILSFYHLAINLIDKFTRKGEEF